MSALIIIFSVLLMIFLLTLVNITIEYSFHLANYKTTFDADISIFGKTIKLNAKNDTKKKKSKNSKKNEQNKENENMSLDDIMRLKDNIFVVINRFFGIMRQAVKIEYFETEVKLALADPFSNGVAYGAVSGFLNIFYALLLEIFKTEKYFLDISHDFNSGEGLIFNNKSKISIRPAKSAYTLIALLSGDKEFRKAFFDIIKTF